MPETSTYIDTADVIAVATVDATRCVLLIERDWPPFAGQWALPGGHVDPGEAALDAAAREVAEETGVRIATQELAYLGTYDAPGRDPRGAYRTTAYLAALPEPAAPVAADDARTARWVPISALPGVSLAFDHREILRAALTPR